MRKSARKSWPTKQAFVQDHLDMPVLDLIELGRSYGIELTKGTIYTSRYKAKRDESVAIVPHKATLKATATLVHTEATLTVHTEADSLDAMLNELLDEEITVGNIKSRIAKAVRGRIEVLGRAKVETMVQECAKDEIKAYFDNL